MFKPHSIVILLCSALAAHQALAANKPETASAPFKSEKDTLSYVIGVSVGRNFRREDFEINQDVFMQGLKDALAGSALKLSEKDYKTLLAQFQTDMQRKMVANKREEGEKNRKKGEAFLAENKKKDGVVTLPSGVQYKILKGAEGKKPQDSDIVTVNYRGTLLDGTEFDATAPEKPAHLKLSQLIPGWKEAVKLMPVGSKWQVFIPSQAAYGDRGVGAEIGPGETLVFEVELLDAKP